MAASNPAADTSIAKTGSKSQSRKARKSSKGFSRFIAGFAGGLVATASLMPATASIVIVAAYVILNGPQDVRPSAVAQYSLVYWIGNFSFWFGILFAFVVWFVLAACLSPFAAADRANVRVYSDLCDRLEGLTARLTNIRKPVADDPETFAIAREEALALRNAIADDLGYPRCESGDPDAERPRPSTGPRWVSGTGYINVWNRLHRAEEALIDIEPSETVIHGAVDDWYSIQGSKMPNTAILSALLIGAVRELDPKAARYFTLPDASTKASNDTATRGQDTTDADRPDPKAAAGARARLRQIRHTVNMFRDDRWDGLVRARNQLVRTTTFTGITACGLLGLAVTMRVPPAAVVGAATFYLVGGVIGLVNQLRKDAETGSAVEDYGLSTARLVYTPLFSGVAAVGGVLLTALLAVNVVQTGVATTAQPTIDQAAQLLRIFDLGQSPFGLIIAAIFGLTPNQLISRLKQQTDQVKEEIRSTQGPS